MDHEIDDTTNPYEAGLGWVVKPQAKDFIGKAKIVAVKDAGLSRKLIGFELSDRGIPRQGYKLIIVAGYVSTVAYTFFETNNSAEIATKNLSYVRLQLGLFYRQYRVY